MTLKMLWLNVYFERSYTARRLCNWERPRWHPPRPRQLKGCSKIIANDAGHLLPGIKNSLKEKHPWGNFRSTYEFPDRITRRIAESYHNCLIRRDKWVNFPQKKSVCKEISTKCPCEPERPFCTCKCEAMRRILQFDPTRHRMLHKCEMKEREPFDLEYVPGDFTPLQQQHPSRRLLLEDKYNRDNNIEPELPLNKLYLGDHLTQQDKLAEAEPTFTAPRPQTAALTGTALSPSLREIEEKLEARAANISLDLEGKMPRRSITEKPNERCPSPVIPAYANFELAKRMHHDNLDHQPLPDCVADLAYRKLQITGAHAGLALDIEPIATGVGVKTHNAGPTHCTKLKVFRPRTCGVVPKAYSGDFYRPAVSAQPSKPAGAMDLAIRWDYKPANPADEPQPPPHIDGSGDTAGPAVFTYVKTPRDETQPDLGRSAGVFNSTAGEADFFDKDIMRRKTDFTGRSIDREADCVCSTDVCRVPAPPRAHSVSRNCTLPHDRLAKHYQSSPDLGEAYRAIREKYLGPSKAAPCEPLLATDTGCRRDKKNFFQRACARFCHKVAPEPRMCCHGSSTIGRHCRAPPFRVGVPKYNAAGHFISSDSGCSMDSVHGNRVLVVPRPRNPYSKRNYDIDTLVPPFRCYGGGAGEGGYPEHWRLASVYQHAYKPLEQRRRSLLQTVYK